MFPSHAVADKMGGLRRLPPRGGKGRKGFDARYIMQIIIKEGRAVVINKEFDREVVRIGSRPECQIQLGGSEVRDCHLVIQPSPEGGWWIEPGDPSAPPVLFNGGPLKESRGLGNGDEAKIDKYAIKFYLSIAEHNLGLKTTSVEELARIKEFPIPGGSVVKRTGDPVTLSAAQLQRWAQAAADLFALDDVAKVLDCAVTLVLDCFAGRSAWLGVRREPDGEFELIESRTSKGLAGGEPQLYETLLYRCGERGQQLCIPQAGDSGDGCIMSVPLFGKSGCIGLLYVACEAGTAGADKTGLDLLTAISIVLSLKLQSLNEAQTRDEEATAVADSKLLRKIQERLEPAGAPNWKGLQLAVHHSHGNRRLGDVYDFVPVGAHGAAVLLAHVVGKSGTVVLSMAELRAMFRSGVAHSDAPHVMMRHMNALLMESQRGVRVRAIIVMIDAKSGMMQYCAAGLPGAVITTGQGTAKSLTSKDIPELGAADNHPYASITTRLQHGETLALFTGGVNTIANRRGQTLGAEQFVQVLCDGAGPSAEGALDDILVELNEYFQDGRQPDDITILLMYRPRSQAAAS